MTLINTQVLFSPELKAVKVHVLNTEILCDCVSVTCPKDAKSFNLAATS